MSIEQYETVCKEQFSKINSKLDMIHNRLYIDNGSPCIQTRLDRNERMWKIVCWIVAMFCAASIAQITKDVVDHYNASHAEKVIKVQAESKM